MHTILWCMGCTHLAELLGAVLLCLIAYYYFKISRHGPPATVWPLIPIIGDAFQFLYYPSSYFQRCRSRLGPVFRCIVGGRRIIVVCDDIGIQAVLRDKTRILSTYTAHRDVCAAIANVTPDASRYLPDFLLPLSSEIFSMAGLLHITPALNRVLYNYVEGMKSAAGAGSPANSILLSQFVGKAIYDAVSVGVFGETFPLSTYPHYNAIDRQFADLMTGIPFLIHSTKVGRSDFITKAGEYIDRATVLGRAGTLPEPGKKILAILSNPDLSTKDRDGLFVMFIWGLHSSTIRTAFWLFVYLLNDPIALRLVRDEIDRTLLQFEDIDSLLDAPPGALDGPGFVYLTSAVKEALRLSSVIAPVREVREDTFVTLSTGESIPLQRGEFVMANIPMLHSNSDSPCEFRVDRYVAKDGKKPPYMPWGGGEHVCKGRFLAMHTVKMFTIMVLHSLDLSAMSKFGESLNIPYMGYDTTFMERWQLRLHQPLYIRPSKRCAMRPPHEV